MPYLHGFRRIVDAIFNAIGLVEAESSPVEEANDDDVSRMEEVLHREKEREERVSQQSASAMPYLHGFRRIVDAIFNAIGLVEAESSPVEEANDDDVSRMEEVLHREKEREERVSQQSASAMPYLHGFRRIVDAIFNAIGLVEAESSPVEEANDDDVSRMEEVLHREKEREERVSQQSASAMPYLHGFRRIVDAIFNAIGLVEAESSPVEEANDDDVSRMEEVLHREKEIWDEGVFTHGISYALLKVAQRGRLAAARTLLHHGALLDFEDLVSYSCCDDSALHMAVMGVHPLMVELLVQHGADINRRDRVHERSALDLAAEDCGRLPCLKMLLQLGANVNTCDDNGKTALLHALGESDPVWNDNSENIRLLLEGGARVRVRTRNGDYTMQWVVDFLQRFSKEAELSSDKAAAFGGFCTRIISMLVDHGAQIHSDMCVTCVNEEFWPSLEDVTSLGGSLLNRFHLLFPLCVSLLSRGVSLSAVCCCHHKSPALEVAPCNAGVELLLHQLERRLGRNPNLDCAEQCEVLEKALALLDISDACCAGFEQGLKSATNSFHSSLSPSHPAQQIRERLHEERNQPCTLTRLCRRFLRRQLPTPLEDSVALLPLPTCLQDFLVPEVSFLRRPGWDRLKRSPDLSQPSSPQPDES